jgi:hypothetical protein
MSFIRKKIHAFTHEFSAGEHAHSLSILMLPYNFVVGECALTKSIAGQLPKQTSGLPLVLNEKSSEALRPSPRAHSSYCTIPNLDQRRN